MVCLDGFVKFTWHYKRQRKIVNIVASDPNPPPAPAKILSPNHHLRRLGHSLEVGTWILYYCNTLLYTFLSVQ